MLTKFGRPVSELALTTKKKGKGRVPAKACEMERKVIKIGNPAISGKIGKQQRKERRKPRTKERK